MIDAATAVRVKVSFLCPLAHCPYKDHSISFELCLAPGSSVQYQFANSR